MDNLTLRNISSKIIVLFLLKIWILTNLISAFIFIAINDYGIDGSVIFSTILFENEFWKSVFLVFFIGLIYSTPAMLILGLIIKLCTYNKLILVILSIFLVIVTFYFTGSMALKNSKIPIPTPSLIYSIVISTLFWIIPLMKKTT